jgi:hypothetical protein
VVDQLEPVQVIDGTATTVRLRLAYGPHTCRDGLPDQMCVKGGFGTYRDGRVGFVDRRTVAVGPWVHDVNYVLVSALDVPDRRAHERELLGHCLKALASFGVSAPGLDEAWSDYRRATVHGFLGWLCNPDVWQPGGVGSGSSPSSLWSTASADIYPLPGRIRRHRKAIRRRGGPGDTQRGTHPPRPARHVRARRSRGG